MALLPVLLDMVDEIYNNLDDQSKTFTDSIPMLFVPHRAGGGHCGRGGMRFGGRPQCQFPKGNGCQRRCQRGSAKPTSEEFQVALDAKSYKPEEVSVKVKDREIIVEGKHEERQDEYGFISRQFTRRYILPQEFDPDTVSTFMNAEGKMTIKATKPQPAAVETTERIIPIQREPSALAAAASEQEQEWEKVDETAVEQPKKVEEEEAKKE